MNYRAADALPTDLAGPVAFGLAALAVVLATRWVANRLAVPFTVLLTVIGAVYGLLPGPNVTLRPDIVLTTVIPPLLYSAALGASLLDIRRYIRAIASLSVGLVLASAFAVGALLTVAVGKVGFAAAVALGAAVAPPDPVAALSIGRRVGLPPRVTTVIEGEGLLNDATALTTFQVATAAATGSGFSMAYAAGDFLLSAAGGAAIGALIGWALGAIPQLRSDALLANGVSLATPFLCYLLAEEAHVSGVLAVVVAGLLAGHRLPRQATSGGRMQVSAVWRLVDFLLEGLVFLLIGQQLPAVVAALDRYDAGTIAAAVCGSVGVVLAVRPLWLASTGLLPRRLRLVSDYGDTSFTRRELVVLSWSGMRGVITLAAAYSLPLSLPERDLLLFCAFVIVVVTLVGQGLTFAPLARRLGVRASATDGIRERNEARLAAVEAALARLEDIDSVSPDVRAGLRRGLEERERRYRRRLDAVICTDDEGQVTLDPGYLAAVAARRDIIQAQRDQLLRWRESGRLSESDLRRLQSELDHEESQLPRAP